MGARDAHDPVTDPVAALIERFNRLGAERYGMEAISQLAHALQCARLAELAGASDALIAAALLHDVGHLLQNDMHDAPKEDHSVIGARYLAAWFDEDVVAPIRLHAGAKRYLVGTDPLYFHGLSAASRRSLKWQGGALDDASARHFMQQPYARDAAALRRWDDRAKEPELVTPPFAHYRSLLQDLRRR